ncbi:hypothetical protein EG329_007521 [Mollisiaceae sp. DMI_Dod_QoI]|nr:hypothetical protein EG329_007521 [Helotiales sp. DMI_Dod_QoI]
MENAENPPIPWDFIVCEKCGLHFTIEEDFFVHWHTICQHIPVYALSPSPLVKDLPAEHEDFELMELSNNSSSSSSSESINSSREPLLCELCGENLSSKTKLEKPFMEHIQEGSGFGLGAAETIIDRGDPMDLDSPERRRSSMTKLEIQFLEHFQDENGFVQQPAEERVDEGDPMDLDSPN